VGKMSKSKGYRGERELIRLLQAYKIAAKRQPLSGAATPNNPGDVLIPTWFSYRAAEVKFREDLPNRLWDWLESAPALFLRRRHKPWLIVMDLQDFIQLLGETSK